MNKILTVKQAITIAKKLREQGKSIVLAGGCFDILHIGHILFLEKAKKTGDILFILLESDEKIRSLKGQNRPINTQGDRAYLLSAVSSVNYVILLPFFTQHRDYDKLVIAIKPAIIATTNGDPYLSHKQRQAKLSGSHLIQVLKNIKNNSTTRLIELLSQEKNI